MRHDSSAGTHVPHFKKRIVARGRHQQPNGLARRVGGAVPAPQEAQRQADLDEKSREWTAYLNSPEYAAEQQKNLRMQESFTV